MKVFQSTAAALNVAQEVVGVVLGYEVKLREFDIEDRTSRPTSASGPDKSFTIIGTVIQKRPDRWKTAKVTRFELMISLVFNSMSYAGDDEKDHMQDNYHVHGVGLLKLDGKDDLHEFEPKERHTDKQREQVMCYRGREFTIW